eukprot:3181527-Prymnesium_polylepis.1
MQQIGAAWEACATQATIVVSVATTNAYHALTVRTAVSAHAIGVPCVAVAAAAEVTSSHRLVRRLPLAFASAWRPPPEWCRRKLAGWRHASVLKTHAMLLVLSRGSHVLFVDADWRFGRASPLETLAACGHDAVALKDRGHFVNVGLLYVRSSPATIAVARRTANRSVVAWDQAVFNEEAGAPGALMTCCHANRVFGRHFHRDRSAHVLKHTAATGAEHKCAARHPDGVVAIDAAALPPPNTRHPGEVYLYRSKWDPANFNELSDEARHRCPGCQRACSRASCRCHANRTVTPSVDVWATEELGGRPQRARASPPGRPPAIRAAAVGPQPPR